MAHKRIQHSKRKSILAISFQIWRCFSHRDELSDPAISFSAVFSTEDAQTTGKNLRSSCFSELGAIIACKGRGISTLYPLGQHFSFQLYPFLPGLKAFQKVTKRCTNTLKQPGAPT
ncbi:hypothetical protein CEXT_703801 [Caerostris extrusa]|uniref:Uncharacterized protein n=1 Tax=Caerostris extrusa TaxID=172846 RepID=A0AAV4P4M0_CAEEX|nr:hypothetical protein CEXT_703801 [Caerostris extrusa]